MQFPDGRETTISTKQLAPTGSNEINQSTNIPLDENIPEFIDDNSTSDTVHPGKDIQSNQNTYETGPVLRRSERVRRAPDKLNLCDCDETSYLVVLYYLFFFLG